MSASWQSCLALQQGFAYQTGGNTLRVTDLRDPTTPRLAAELTWPGEGGLSGVAWSGDVALMARWTRVHHTDDWRVAVLDTSDPGHPVEVASLGPWTDTLSVASIVLQSDGGCVGTSEPRLRSGCGRRAVIRVLDLRQPADPRVVGQLAVEPGGLVRGASLCRDTLYVASSQLVPPKDELVVDVRDPTQPRLVEQRETNRLTPWVCDGYYAYAVEERGAAQVVSVIDIRDPWHPLSVGQFGPFHAATLAGGSDGRLYVKDLAGLTVLQIDR
jgi:hypothetical protein